MRRAVLLTIIFFVNILCRAQGIPPIGQWREHLPYQQSIALEYFENKIFSATSYSLFSIDPSDNSIERYSKMTGLTETGIRTIGTDATGAYLVVVYSNGNIDLVAGPDVVNMPEIFRSQLITDKTINQVYNAAGQTLLAGNEAIYVLNAERNEIQDTYVIGNGGAKIRVNALAVYNNVLFAATPQGLKSAPLNGPNLSDFRNWTNTDSPVLPFGEYDKLITIGSKLIASRANMFYAFDGLSWSLFYSDSWKTNSIQVSENHLVLNQVNGNQGRLTILDVTGSVVNTIQNDLLKDPFETVTIDSEYWIADKVSGLAFITAAGIKLYNPPSPSGILYGAIRSNANKTVAVSGSPAFDWEPIKSKGVISSIENSVWTNYSPPITLTPDSFPDLIAVAIDPVDGSTWAGSYGGGLIHIAGDGSAVLFKEPLISETYFTAGQYRVSGLEFDAANNLWISNYGAGQNLVTRKPDGSVVKFKIPFPLTENAVSRIVIDDLDQKWIISPGGNGLICFNHGSTVENPADDQWKWYRNGIGAGNLPDNNIMSIAKDKDGFIWVGTSKGIGIIRCIQEVFSSEGCEAILPVVQQDNFAGYLFSNEQVQAIAVDGANRKWVGTKNGLWLLSETGEKIIYRFSTENSPLLSNNVLQLSIDPKSGEVFVSTESGLCSFRSTATETTTTSQNLLVFPNPVPPGYTGTIAIRGVAENAIVKITELNGNLVFQARALGGQAVWNGRDYKGKQISSGVYLVLISDDQRQNQVATKIVYIKK